MPSTTFEHPKYGHQRNPHNVGKILLFAILTKSASFRSYVTFAECISAIYINRRMYITSARACNDLNYVGMFTYTMTLRCFRQQPKSHSETIVVQPTSAVPARLASFPSSSCLVHMILYSFLLISLALHTLINATCAEMSRHRYKSLNFVVGLIQLSFHTTVQST